MVIQLPDVVYYVKSECAKEKDPNKVKVRRGDNTD